MQKLGHFVFGMLVAAVVTTPASACLPPKKPAFWSDKKIMVGADCSFKNAEADHYYDVDGTEVKDLGGGRVGQRLEYSDFCGHGEWLLVVDCASRESLLLKGEVNPQQPDDLGGGPAFSVDMLYPPNGKVRLTPNMTIGGLEELADRAGYDHSETFDDWMNRVGGGKKKNAYDQFCGCEIFYPENMGATE